RRRLHHEGEALVRVGRDHDRDRQPGFHLLRLCVERLAEFHDVQSALPERRADRRTRVRLPRRHLQLDESDYLLRHSCLLRGSQRMRIASSPFKSHVTAVTEDQAFSTCEKSNSTGVERPKIVTETRSLLFS